MFHIYTTSLKLVQQIQNINYMQFKLSSTESAILDICQIFGIEKLTPFKYDQLKDIIINVERNGKYEGVINHGKWKAEVNINTNMRSLTVNDK